MCSWGATPTLLSTEGVVHEMLWTNETQLYATADQGLAKWDIRTCFRSPYPSFEPQDESGDTSWEYALLRPVSGLAVPPPKSKTYSEITIRAYEGRKERQSILHMRKTVAITSVSLGEEAHY